MTLQSPENFPALFDFTPVKERVLPEPIEAAMRRHDNVGIWLSGHHKHKGNCRGSYVYLLVHKTQNRFKIGKSIDPKTRFEYLPEAEEVDTLRSLQVLLPSQRRALQIESMLHKALAFYRLQPKSWVKDHERQTEKLPANARGGGRDGETEWFALPAFTRAVELLKLVPGPNGYDSLVWQTIEGDPWPDHAQRSFTLREQYFKKVEQHNLDQSERIFDVLIVISKHHKIVWTPSASAALSAGTLKIIGIKAQWSLIMIAARFSVTASSLWELKILPRKRDAAYWPIDSQDLLPASVCPFAKIITYSKTNPDDLELVINSPKAINKVPGGKLALQRWLEFVEGLRV